MAEDLLKIVENEVTSHTSPDQIREKLVQQGYLEEEVEKAIQEVSSKRPEAADEKRLNKLFSTKETFDRMGYGFVPHQFINILFYLTGSGYLWLGVVNGARTILSIIISSMLQEYSKVKQVSKGVISKSGYLFGFSFLGLAVAALLKSVPLFAFFVLLGAIGVVGHGDLYKQMLARNLKKEHMGNFMSKVAEYGVLITGICMLISGWIMDLFPITGAKTVTIMGNTYPVLGYLLSFEVTAIAFIISGFVLSHVKDKVRPERVKGFLKGYWRSTRIYLGTFMRNKNIFFLIFTAILIGLVQVLGNSYYGVFIYNNFKEVALGGMVLGGFMIVALIYFIAILFSFLGPWFSKKMQKHTGLAPTLVFGTLLTAMMPLVLAYNPNLPAIAMANTLSVIGAAILGVSQGLLVNKLLREDERRVYFSAVSMAAVIPFIFLVPAGAYLAQNYGLEMLFKLLAGVLVCLVAPIYILLVLFGNKQRL